MAPSGLYQIARGDASMHRDEAQRYARLEYGSPSTAWMLPAEKRPTLWTNLRLRVAAVFGRAPAHAATSNAHADALRADVLAAHPAVREHRHASAAHSLHPHAALEDLAIRDFVLPAPKVDDEQELCECHP